MLLRTQILIQFELLKVEFGNNNEYFYAEKISCDKNYNRSDETKIISDGRIKSISHFGEHCSNNHYVLTFLTKTLKNKEREENVNYYVFKNKY